MANLTRSYDWGATTLGPLENWAEDLDDTGGNGKQFGKL